mgnify:CR=1 FL=1
MRAFTGWPARAHQARGDPVARVYARSNRQCSQSEVGFCTLSVAALGRIVLPGTLVSLCKQSDLIMFHCCPMCLVGDAGLEPATYGL